CCSPPGPALWRQLCQIHLPKHFVVFREETLRSYCGCHLRPGPVTRRKRRMKALLSWAGASQNFPLSYKSFKRASTNSKENRARRASPPCPPLVRLYRPNWLRLKIHRRPAHLGAEPVFSAARPSISCSTVTTASTSTI